MSLTSINSAPSSSLATSAGASRTERPEPAAAGIGATLAGIATAATDGVSATVSFSEKALHALEEAGETVVDGVEDAAIGAWHALQHVATEVEHAGEAVVDTLGDGVDEIVKTARSVGNGVGHYAKVGLSATGDALCEVASGSVLAAAAVGKSIIALI
jgi:hypothetical protein